MERRGWREIPLRRKQRNRKTRDRIMFGFGWVIEGKLAGMGRPGSSLSDLGQDLRLLAEEGISAIVTLTEDTLKPEPLEAAGFEHIHIPVWDMSAPSQGDIQRFVQFVSSLLEAGRAVSVHCAMGLGRTGTMLACYLVYSGMDAHQAIGLVREKRPGSIETNDQVDAVAAYARELSEARI